ncbi:MAG: hypothetical protein ABII00_00445 [Elusimicrobiota bacterium]
MKIKEHILKTVTLALAIWLVGTGYAGVDSRPLHYAGDVDAGRSAAERAPARAATGGTAFAAGTTSECAAMALEATVLQAQYEMRSLAKDVPLSNDAALARAMDSDSELAGRIESVFARSGLVNSEFTADAGCEVTVRLPVSRLKELSGRRFQ